MATNTLDLNSFSYAELFTAAGLCRLDQAFLTFLKTKNSTLFDQLLAYRQSPEATITAEVSERIIAWAKYLELFLADFFSVQEALAINQARTLAHNPISAFKKYYVLRHAKRALQKKIEVPSFQVLDVWLKNELLQADLTSADLELSIALLGLQWLNQPEKYQTKIDKLILWCIQALKDDEAKPFIKNWKIFQLPQRLDYDQLIKVQKITHDKFERLHFDESQLRLRDGFDLTDKRMDPRQVQDEVNYCIYCHDKEGDFCSRGFPEKKGDPAKGFKKNPLEVILTGCPLEEKISEMHALKREGHTLAALAVVMIDNPLCPATGHRICNECMKACIYQKQEPVNIPQIETRVLTDVLDLPWGVEIYDLLTRWNPLRNKQWMMKPYNGLKVMIAGMGPAGFTLAHHLLMEGFAVVGLDGLKIEPLEKSILNHPIYKFNDLKENLDSRLMAGFGGVAEYGITVRWDKNFLKLIYLSLMRRPYFQVFGSVRFGGTIKIEDAWEMGFDHFVVAVGAGLPKALHIPNSLAPGMRQANDFLMALQLGSAAKIESLTNLQIRMPAVVIGGGLTGVDTATELQAYYIKQVEKILFRYEILLAKHGLEYLRNQFDINAWEIIQEYLQHGEEIQKERMRAQTANEKPNFIKLIHNWGGVTIVYRKQMQESPAYINNHEELKKALEEGIYYAENLEPLAVELDEHGHCRALTCQQRIRTETGWIIAKEDVTLPARSILVATGTQPNIAYEFEHRGTFNRLNLQYQHYEDQAGQLTVAPGALHCKEKDFGPFTSYQKNDFRVSLVGDTHPVFHGSVVKAIASGMKTYSKILAILQDKLHQVRNTDTDTYQQFATKIASAFDARLISIIKKTDHIYELKIKAPLAAKHYRPGQFYRLQNFEKNASYTQHTRLLMEPLALVASACDKNQGILSFLVYDNSPTAKIAIRMQPGEAVSLMGPTGVRAKIPTEGETVLIIGTVQSFAFLLSYATELRLAGNRIIYLLKYHKAQEIYCQEALTSVTDCIIWLSETEPALRTVRDEDFITQGNSISQALVDYASKKTNILLTDVDRVFIVGDTNLLREFQAARNNELKGLLIKNPKVFGSVYGNMQCMLKGVCAQCLQWQVDPETGQRTKAVFTCSWQDQPLEIIDIDHIDARSLQNHVHERLSHLWLDHIFYPN